MVNIDSQGRVMTCMTLVARSDNIIRGATCTMISWFGVTSIDEYRRKLKRKGCTWHQFWLNINIVEMVDGCTIREHGGIINSRLAKLGSVSNIIVSLPLLLLIVTTINIVALVFGSDNTIPIGFSA